MPAPAEWAALARPGAGAPDGAEPGAAAPGPLHRAVLDVADGPGARPRPFRHPGGCRRAALGGRRPPRLSRHARRCADMRGAGLPDAPVPGLVRGGRLPSGGLPRRAGPAPAHRAVGRRPVRAAGRATGRRASPHGARRAGAPEPPQYAGPARHPRRGGADHRRSQAEERTAPTRRARLPPGARTAAHRPEGGTGHRPPKGAGAVCRTDRARARRPGPWAALPGCWDAIVSCLGPGVSE